MPKDAFFNLSDEKRNRVLEAATNEFEEYILEEVSIKRIIEEAKIPRGSFYQYFYNIEDLFEYKILELQKKIFKENFSFEWVPGFDLLSNLRQGMKRRLQNIMGSDLVEGDFLFMKRVTESDEAKRIFIRCVGIFDLVNEELLDKVHEFCYPKMDKEEMKMMLETLFATVEHSLHKIMNQEKSVDEMNKELDIKFMLVERMVKDE